MVLGYDPWKMLCVQCDRRTLMNRGIQITTKPGKNKDWIRQGFDKRKLGTQSSGDHNRIGEEAATS